MQIAFKKNIEKNLLFDKNDRILLAISGGVDSIVMLHLFIFYKYNIEVAHCNFMLRENDSLADENFVKDICTQNNIPFHCKQFNTKTYAANNKISIEEAARDLRYNWFDSLLTKQNLTCVATAHHKNDVGETILLNMVRGTGIAGLHGIMPKLKKIVRPLLFATKKDIEQYATENKILFRIDKSNSLNIYTRNKIRNQIIPIIETINPDFISTINTLADIVKDTENIFNYYINTIKNNSIIIDNGTIIIDTKKINSEVLNKTLVFELIKKYGFNTSQSVNIYNALGSSGKIFYANNYTLVVDRSKIIITKETINNIDNKYIINQLPYTLKTETASYYFELIIVDKTSDINYKNKSFQYICFDKIRLPISIRKPLPGEYFSPYGLKGKKKISDYFIDKKIDIISKQKVLCLYHNKLVALLGLEIDNSFAVDKNSKQLLRITIQKNI